MKLNTLKNSYCKVSLPLRYKTRLKLKCVEDNRGIEVPLEIHDLAIAHRPNLDLGYVISGVPALTLSHLAQKHRNQLSRIKILEHLAVQLHGLSKSFRINSRNSS
jgi:hypothetical protein